MLAIVLSDALHLARVDVFCGPDVFVNRQLGTGLYLQCVVSAMSLPEIWSVGTLLRGSSLTA